MTRAEFFAVAQHLRECKSDSEHETMAERSLFTKIVNKLARNLYPHIPESEFGNRLTDRAAFIDLASGDRTSIPRRGT